MSQLFASGGQNTGVSALASFLPKKSQGRSPSEWTGWICLQSKGLSRVFSNTTVQKCQFFGAQLSSESNFHIHTLDCSLPGSSVHGIFQAGVLEWGAIAFSGVIYYLILKCEKDDSKIRSTGFYTV